MGKSLIALDFDFTTIDEDSDHYIVKVLAPHLMEKMKKLQPTTQWTDLCNILVDDLHGLGYTPAQLRAAQRTIPFNPAMKEAFQHAHSLGHDIIIISDANTIYIEEISKEKGIYEYISHVITNPAHFDENGKLHIDWYSKDQHNCPNRCAKNICKGMVS
jgi:2,3-diketo-5-methylthio-1-phosphopentane phosphatase